MPLLLSMQGDFLFQKRQAGYLHGRLAAHSGAEAGPQTRVTSADSDGRMTEPKAPLRSSP